MAKVSDNDFSGIPLFEKINKSTLKLMQTKAFKIKLTKGEELFCEKDKVDKIYIVLSGKVTIDRKSVV